MSHSYLRNSIEWALMVALVFGTGAFAQAQDQGKEAKGHIVQIGPDNTKDANSGQTDSGDQAAATPGRRPADDAGPAAVLDRPDGRPDSG